MDKGMVIRNWFMMILAIVQICATVQYCLERKYLFAGVQLAYAIANVLFAVMKGE